MQPTCQRRVCRPLTIVPASTPARRHREVGSDGHTAPRSSDGPGGWGPSSGSRSPAWRRGRSPATSTLSVRRPRRTRSVVPCSAPCRPSSAGSSPPSRLAGSPPPPAGLAVGSDHRCRRRRLSTPTPRAWSPWAPSVVPLSAWPRRCRFRCVGVDRVLWAVATPVLWAGGWLITSQVIVDADRQHAVVRLLRRAGGQRRSPASCTPSSTAPATGHRAGGGLGRIERSRREPPRRVRHRPGRQPSSPNSSPLGHDVIAVNRSGRGDFAGADTVAGDATDPAFTTRVAAGADVVYFCLNAGELRPLGRGVPTAATRRARRGRGRRRSARRARQPLRLRAHRTAATSWRPCQPGPRPRRPRPAPR